MSALLHVTVKGPENSGYIWDEFYCPECLEKKLAVSTWLKVIRQTRSLSRKLSHF